MDKIQETYLELLRAAIWNQEAQVEVQPEELVSIVRLAAFQGTESLVYDQLLKLKNVIIPSPMRMQMKQQCLHSMLQQQSMCSILTKAYSALIQENIHPVLLKGFSIAQYYPQPHLRQWGDVDLYVGKAQYHKACEVLRSALPEAKHPKEEFEFLKHYNFVFDNTILELHRISMDFHHPHDRRYYERLEATYLTKDGPACELNGLAVTIPEETFNVFFVFLHAWHHFVETGMSMKQLCDIAIMLHARKKYIDLSRLRSMLIRLHLMEVWQLIMYILVHCLGRSAEECPFYTQDSRARAELLLERVMREGQSRKSESSCEVPSVPYLKRKWITFQSRMADSRLIKPYAPRYARHMAISSILHGIERTIKGSEKAENVECV